VSAILSDIDREEAEHAAQAQQLRAAFLLAASECQSDKFALFAPRVKDWQHGGMRLQTVGEMMQGMLDYEEFGERAMQVLLNAAAGRGTQREAQLLLQEIAAGWADRSAE
jgi:hypothetical protein